MSYISEVFNLFNMAFDSIHSLRSFLFLVIVLTMLVLVNMVWSLGYLYSTLRLSSVYTSFIKSDTETENRNTNPFYYSREFTFQNLVKSTNRNLTSASGGLKIVQPVNENPKTVKPINKGLPPVTKTTNRPDTCENCFEHKFNYIIQNKDVCKEPKGGYSQIDLMVFVFTVHDHFKQREVIRQTWLSMSNGNRGNVRHVFLLGYVNNSNLSKKVEEENNKHHDIIKESFVDSYQNLTYKTIMAFKWLTYFCPSARFVMKTDDDMYVNLPAILNVLNKEEKNLQTSVSGSCSTRANPIRDTRSKWYASLHSYPHRTYPGFCSGTGYVTSKSVAQKIYEISKTVPFFHLEDVYVALCVKKLGFKLRRLPGFHSYRVKLDPCFIKSNKVLTSHEIPTDFLIKVRDANCR